MQLTMKDIALEFNTSVSTVSRALKNSPRISEDMRRAIQDYARRHNFYPNAIAESLRHSKVMPSRIIGVIVPELAHYYFSTVLSGIEQEARLRGYNIMVAQSDELYDREVDICQAFYMNKVCGIIVSQAKDTVNYEHFEKLVRNGVPLVFYDRICTGINTNRVVVDDYDAAYMAVSHLLKTGCRRIAFFSSPMGLEISKNRFNGYKDALLRNGCRYDSSLVYVCDNREEADNLVPKLLCKKDHPDGFFAVNDDTAIGILYSAKRLGFKVPDEISICGFTNGQRSIACDPMLTTIEQKGNKVGEQAADILISQLEGAIPMDHVEKRIVRTRLIVRGTTR